MKKILCLAIVIFGLAFPAGADSLKSGLACLTKNLYDQAVTAAAREDKNAWAYLMKNGCIITKSGLTITVLEIEGWIGPAKVRVYLGEGQTIVMWTSLENIENDKK